MAKQIKTIDYDYDNDIFFISKGEKVKSSLDIGEFILDVNQNNLICGIEIMDASDNLGMSKEVLSKINNLKMSITYKTNHVFVLLMIIINKEGKEVNISIPLTIGLGHKEPMKEVLVYN